MDTNSLMLSFVFGMVGMGMFMYGKKAERLVPLAAGVGLMVMPYFAPNLLVMGVVCCGLMAMPWLVRGA